MASNVAQRWSEEIADKQRKLATKLPDIDPLDLHQILRSILQPTEVPRVFLIKGRRDGGLEF